MSIYTKILGASDPSIGLEQEVDSFHGLNRRALEEMGVLGEAVFRRALVGESYRQKDALPEQFKALEDAITTLTDYVDDLEEIPKVNKTLLKGKKTHLLRKLGEATRELHYLFTFGYHQPVMAQSTVDSPFIHPLIREPFDSFRRILAADSSPHLMVSSITTLEDYVRVMHEQAVGSFGRVAERLSEGYGIYELSRHHHISSPDTLPVPEEILKSPMGAIVRAFEHYNRGIASSRDCVAGGFITKRSFWWISKLGYHMGYWFILYDAADDSFDVRFELGEGGYGNCRIEYCTKLFPLEGFTDKGWHNLYRARKKVQLSDLHKTMTFLLFIAPNLFNLDLKPARFEPQELVERFEVVYRHQMRVQGTPLPGDEHNKETMGDGRVGSLREDDLSYGRQWHISL
ncbi:hypothetical protein HYW21_07855 [Candidatus Woesearchaeota archaeon]|nr:hypothetical protein [Candidatus Woesearchaeota archaeon]